MQGELITVLITNLMRAQILRGRLESEGIPVFLKYESLGPILGITVNGLGDVEVQVPREWETRAREIIAEIEGG